MCFIMVSFYTLGEDSSEIWKTVIKFKELTYLSSPLAKSWTFTALSFSLGLRSLLSQQFEKGLEQLVAHSTLL